MIHIGKFIKQRLLEQGKSPEWLASQLPHNTLIEHLLDSGAIDADLLIQICHILKYDFFQEYSHELRKFIG